MPALERFLSNYVRSPLSRVGLVKPVDRTKNPYPVLKTNMDYQPVDTEFVKFESRAGCRIIKLRRHASLNALNLSMIRTIFLALSFWQRSPECRSVLIMSEDAENSRAFCSGGDIVSIHNQRGNLGQQLTFFKEEYALNHLIAVYNKPIVSLWNGYVSILNV